MQLYKGVSRHLLLVQDTADPATLMMKTFFTVTRSGNVGYRNNKASCYMF